MPFTRSLTIFLTSAFWLLAVAKGESIEVNTIVAKVNGKVITKNEIAVFLAPVFAQLSAQFPRRGQEFERRFFEARDKILQETIDGKIILDEFKKLGGNIKPSMIDQEVKRFIQESYQGNEGRFREELKKSRLTMEGYRDLTREKLIVQAMRAQQTSQVAPPLPHEIQKEYQEIKKEIRDTTQDIISFKKIFIPRLNEQEPKSTSESQLALAESLAQQIKEGKNFAELAKQHSKDAYSEAGGLQENVQRKNLSPEFGAIIMDAPLDKLTGPLEDPQGFTLVIPTSKTYGPSPSLEEVRELVIRRVSNKKSSVQYEKWIESRRKRAIIKVYKDRAFGEAAR